MWQHDSLRPGSHLLHLYESQYLNEVGNITTHMAYYGTTSLQLALLGI
jgi:hypothetical protein